MKTINLIVLTCLMTSQGYLFSQKPASVNARILTLDESMEIAGNNSPAIQKSRYNMEKTKNT